MNRSVFSTPVVFLLVAFIWYVRCEAKLGENVGHCVVSHRYAYICEGVYACVYLCVCVLMCAYLCVRAHDMHMLQVNRVNFIEYTY